MFACNNIPLISKWNLAFLLLAITLAWNWQLPKKYFIKNKLGDWVINYYWTRLSQNIVICQCLTDQLLPQPSASANNNCLPLTKHGILLNLVQELLIVTYIKFVGVGGGGRWELNRWEVLLNLPLVSYESSWESCPYNTGKISGL